MQAAAVPEQVGQAAPIDAGAVAGAAGGGLTGQAALGANQIGGGATTGIEGILANLQQLIQQINAVLGGGGADAGAGAAVPGQIGQVGQVDQAHGAGHAGGVGLPTPPPANDPRFLAGSTGPTVQKGDAETLKIPDGRGFGDTKGRKQNADDKKKNNYSVTDANFSNQLGLLATDPDTGKPMNYVQHIQTYAAANYLEAYAHPLYEKLTANQNAGTGTILGAAAYLMGLTKTPDPALGGITQAEIATIPAQIPGTPMDARAYVMSGKDITGQVWARPHHAGSQFKVLSGLLDAGVPWQQAMVLAGDDGISGSGRLNGVNTQDGQKTGMNDGEEEIFSLGAQIQQQTGIPVIQIMMGGHNHLGGDESALTNPKMNRLLSKKYDVQISKDARQASIDRANLVYQSFLDGTSGDADDAKQDGTKADYKKLLAAAQGPIAPRQLGALNQAKVAQGLPAQVA
jgi:hypothetical protein